MKKEKKERTFAEHVARANTVGNTVCSNQLTAMCAFYRRTERVCVAVT